MAKDQEKILEELKDMRYKQGLILSALRNVLDQDNPNGVNDYLLDQIKRVL